MGKRSWSLLLAMALVASVFTILPAKAQTASELKFFLRSTGCPVADVNFDYLSITDGDDAIECNYTGSGIRNEIGGQTGTVGAAGNNAVVDRETGSRYWDTTDGGPLTVDVSRPVTGTIFTSGIYCAQPTLCAPGGGSVGEAILDVTLVGLVGETETELSTQTDTFQVVPGAPHATELKMQLNAAAAGARFDTIDLRTWVHGMAVGHNVIRTNADTSSFISIPTASAGPIAGGPGTPTKPGKNDPPGKGKKKGCDNGKGKKKGACPGGKPGKPTPPVVPSCPAYVPGDEGKEAATTVVTDAATAEKPVEVDLTAGAGGGAMPIGGTPVPYDETSSVYQNIQVDAADPSAGLYVRFEFPDRHDYDLYLNYPDGSTAANSGDANAAPGEGLGGGSPDGGWEAGSNYEQVMGIATADCAGYTARMVSFLTTGGAVKLKVWLGDVVAEPVAPGGSQALTNFFDLTGIVNPSAMARMGASGTPAATKGCTKGKGKKKGCNKPPVASCAPLTTGDQGAGKPTVVVTDAATAEAPVEQTVTLGQSTADFTPTDATYDYFNVQIDSAAASAGLYVTFEFDTRRDYDLYARWTDASEAASSHGFNPAIEAEAPEPVPADPSNQRTNHAGDSNADSENLVGVITPDCGGYTIETVNWLGEGGEFTVKLWLGEGTTEPLAPGERPA